ncbi:MAG: [LysW]-lysine hydrolase [Chloroflexi bacterium]|nr:[LysW]-lysine hydrolase [Chloroflexota bacterium]
MMDAITFLEKLVSIPSPSGKEDAVGEYLVQQMTDLSFRAHRDEVGNTVGIVGNPEAEREIVLLGHMDTVPGFIPVRRRGDRLYGRGAVDAKGPLATFVMAAAQVAPRLNDARLVVIGAVEEESCGRGARHLARTMPSPYCAIIGEPSGWEGITLGYKGMLAVDYRRVQPGGHSAGEIPGPAEKAVDFWNQLMAFSQGYNEDRSSHFNTLDPALRDFRTFSDGLDDGAEMNIIVRIPPGLDTVDLEQKMLTWCNGAKLSFPDRNLPIQSEKNTPPVRALLRAIRAEGGRPRFKLKTGTSDMNVVGPVWGCPIVAYGPGDSSLDHTPDEHIDVREFRRGINILVQTLETLTK